MHTWSLDSSQRLAALAEVDVFPGAPDEAFAVYTRLIARVLDVPTALVSFVNGDCQFFPAATGLDAQTATSGQTPLSLSFCQHVVTSDDDFVITDAVNDERVKDHVAVSTLGVKAYLGVPLRAPGGEPLGALCAVDTRPHDWTASDIATMHDLAEAVAATIAWRVSEHRRAAVAAEASHELCTPLTRLRFELDDLNHTVGGADAAVAHVDEIARVVDGFIRRARRERSRDTEVDLLSLCVDVASQRHVVDAAAPPVRIEGQAVVVRSSRTILHHVLALVVGAFGGRPLTLVVGGDPASGRIEVHSPDIVVDSDVIAAARRLLIPSGGRLLERPSADVAFELVLPL